MACFTFSALLRMGADLNTTNICEENDAVDDSNDTSFKTKLSQKYEYVFLLNEYCLSSYHCSRVLPLSQFVEDP